MKNSLERLAEKCGVKGGQGHSGAETLFSGLVTAAALILAGLIAASVRIIGA